MGVRYEKLFEVHIEHKYFTDLHFNGFRVFPTAESQSIFHTYGLLLKIQPGGFAVLYADSFEGKNRDRSSMLKEKITLQFSFQITEPYFFQFTGNLPDDAVKRIFRLSNLDKKEQVRTKSNLLHLSEFVSESEVVSSPDAFKDAGYIEVRLNVNLQEDLYIRFLNRSMHWRYIIVGEHLQQSGNLAIVDKENKKLFSGPVIAALPDGSKGIAFTSDQPIAVTKKANPHFQLVADYDDTTSHFERVLISLLPAPSLSSGPQHNEIIIYL